MKKRYPVLVIFVIVLFTMDVFQNWLPYIIAVNKWKAARLQNYTILVSYGTFSGSYNSRTQIIRDGIIVEENSYTQESSVIDRAFWRIKECLLVFPASIMLDCRAQYHTVYGYPTRFQKQDLDLGQLTVIQVTDIGKRN